MEIANQITNTPIEPVSPETVAGQSPPANTSPAQTKIFPEHDFANQTATTAPQQSATASRSTAGGPQIETGKPHTNAAQTLSREKRGAVLGACAKSEFRECRGGEALAENSSSQVKFDQMDRKETRGESGRGTCEGIAREAMRRIDRNANGQTPDLGAAVSDMSSDIRNSGEIRTDVFRRIQSFQDNPESLGLANYRQAGTTNLNPTGATSRAASIDGLMDSMGGMARGELAYIRVGIQSATATGPADSGHVLLAQRLPANANGGEGSAPDRYTIFDPNNGAFTYDSLGQMQSSLRGYMDSAYNEDNYVATPNAILSFIPPSSRDWGSLPATTTVPAPTGNLLEPRELLQHFAQSYPGASAAGGIHTELKRTSDDTRR
jgi:hypothetical protein